MLNAGRGNAQPDEPPARRRRRRRRDIGGVTFDVLAVLAALALILIGLANLYAVNDVEQATRQTTVAAAGVVLLVALWRFRAKLLMVVGWVTYVAAVLLLGVVHFAGLTLNGARRWIDLGGFTFQPSELAKMGLLLVLAAVLGSTRPAAQRFAYALVLAAVPIALTALQPDLSTTMLLIAVTVAMLIMGRVPARFLLPLFGAAAVAAPLLVGMLRPYQVQRLGTFLVGAHESKTGAGWAVLQAHIALGWGALFGSSSPQTGLLAEYLPEKETDLALASVVQQFGLVAGGVVVVAAIVLVWRLAMASRVPRTPNGALVAGGLAVLVGVEVIVSVGGNLGLLPLAGIPFPLVSYGGTALLVHLAALGVALGVRRDAARRRVWIVPRWRSRRPRLVRALAVGLTGLLVVFGTYAWNLQSVRGAELAAAGEAQMKRCIRIPAERGAITDRHGVPLAVSTSNSASGVDEVIAVPAIVRSRPDDVTRLASLVGQPVEAVRAALDGAPETTLALKVAEVPRPVGDAVEAGGITGVVVAPMPRRSYPTGSLLGPVLGFAGIATPSETERFPDLPSGEIVGRAGLEQQYDSILRGVNGHQCVYVTPPGVPAQMADRVEPVPGADLRTSLDLGLQQQLAASLDAVLPAQRTRRMVGAAVAMDARNGQVLALVSRPSYDNNVYGPPIDAAALERLAKAPGHPMLNHAIQAALPPGSTFKLVMGTAGILHPVFPPDRAIPTGGSFTLGSHTFNNWRAMGPMNLVDAIAWSNNVYFYKLAHALGPDPIIDTAHKLGVGSQTGIDLPGESPGYLGTPESVAASGGTWYGGSTVILGIGQGYLQVTPLQNAKWTAGIATGQLVTPRIGLATGTEGTVYTALPAPAPTPIPFASELGPVREGMRAVVTRGTGAGLAGLPLPVAGKTGTAQDGSLGDNAYDNWLSAVAPADNPSVVMTAVVQGSGNLGQSVVAAGMRYFADHQAEVLATAPMSEPTG